MSSITFAEKKTLRAACPLSSIEGKIRTNLYWKQTNSEIFLIKKSKKKKNKHRQGKKLYVNKPKNLNPRLKKLKTAEIFSK